MTYTPTPTPTDTPTPTPTDTDTPTPTLTYTPTPTDTDTPTPTPTSTGTPTSTPTNTLTPTATYDPALPLITISDKSLFEKNNGNTTFQFTVSLSMAPPTTVTLDYATVSGTATGGSACSGTTDFKSESGTLTIVPPATSANLNITVCTDTNAEPDETFTVELSSPTNAYITDGIGQGIIFDDDSPGFTNGDFVYSISPPDASTNVPVTTTVVIQFNRPMCESSVIDPNNTRLFAAADVSATRVYNPLTWTLTIVPDAPLSYSTSYSVMVRFTKTILDGCNLSAPTRSQSFTTNATKKSVYPLPWPWTAIPTPVPTLDLTPYGPATPTAAPTVTPDQSPDETPSLPPAGTPAETPAGTSTRMPEQMPAETPTPISIPVSQIKGHSKI